MAPALSLLPETDVAEGDSGWLATTEQPWLRAPGLERLAGHWFAVTYAQGLLDEAVRPLLRFRLADGRERRVPLPAAPFGGARWLGRMPTGTVAVSFCPVRRKGVFTFQLVRATRVPRAVLVARGLVQAPGMTLTALGARLIGAREEARHCLAFAATATPLRGYARWRRAGERWAPPLPPMPAGPTIHLLVRPGSPAALARTRASLAAQAYPHWRLWPLNADIAGLSVRSLGEEDDMVALLDAGDRLMPSALAQVAVAAARDPAVQAIVGDEEAGGRYRPQPCWSPLDGDAGLAPFVRLASVADGVRIGAWADHRSPLAGIPADRVATLHRPLWQRDAPHAHPLPPPPPLPEDPFVTVVVPFRDRPALLSACLAGLARTNGQLQVVLVDNGSVDPAACRLAEEAATRGAVLLHRPGPFNYAALCNDGAAAGSAPLLLFLNNDVEPHEPDWLRRMAAQAMRPGVGAVGARLLFPDGRLQHGGVVVGLGGTALHLGRGMRDGTGPIAPFHRPRRVGAVTGAAMMVTRARFGAVGGFDAEAFPILLNDIDLCLRLAARGWPSFYEPRAVLTHRESASRGRAIRPLLLHATERARFADRWGAAIRHDPGFHPALSLWSIPPALG
jgi:GT2 family glycosyltransferase